MTKLCTSSRCRKTETPLNLKYFLTILWRSWRGAMWFRSLLVWLFQDISRDSSCFSRLGQPRSTELRPVTSRTVAPGVGVSVVNHFAVLFIDRPRVKTDQSRRADVYASRQVNNTVDYKRIRAIRCTYIRAGLFHDWRTLDRCRCDWRIQMHSYFFPVRPKVGNRVTISYDQPRLYLWAARLRQQVC